LSKKPDQERSMDVRKLILIVSSVLLVFLMVYLTVIKKHKHAHETAASTAVNLQQQADAKNTPSTDEECPDAAKAVFITDKTIKGNVVWGGAMKIYVVTKSLVVMKGAVLTIKPGVIVKFKGKDTNFSVKGKLIAEGMPDQKIYFTSYKDDAHGGDTNCNGGSTKPFKGAYGRLEPGSRKNIKNCEFLYAKEVK
jgi:hypothetical protein